MHLERNTDNTATTKTIGFETTLKLLDEEVTNYAKAHVG